VLVVGDADTVEPLGELNEPDGFHVYVAAPPAESVMLWLLQILELDERVKVGAGDTGKLKLKPVVQPGILVSTV